MSKKVTGKHITLQQVVMLTCGWCITSFYFRNHEKQTLNYPCILKEKTVILIFEHFVVHKVGHIFGGPSIFGAAETQDVEQFLYTSQWFEP